MHINNVHNSSTVEAWLFPEKKRAKLWNLAFPVTCKKTLKKLSFFTISFKEIKKPGFVVKKLSFPSETLRNSISPTKKLSFTSRNRVSHGKKLGFSRETRFLLNKVHIVRHTSRIV